MHKGLAPGPPDPVRGHPGDFPKAAKDWPNLNFITYHACIQPAFVPVRLAARRSNPGSCAKACPISAGRPNTRILVAPFKNIYAEIGTTWASSVVTFPTVAAHIMGQL